MSLTAPVAHPPLRHRASSTSLRPSLSPQKNQDGLCCRSNSFVVRQQPQESDPTSSSTTSGTTAMSFSPIEPIPRPLEAAAVTVSASDRTMVSLMLARVLQLLPSGGVRHDALELDSPLSSSSARSSTETILPLSAPPDKTSFGDIFDEKARSSSSSSSPRWRLRPSPKIHAPILFVITLFPLSTALVFLALSSLPISVSWPHNIAELAHLGRELASYTNSGWWATWHVVAVMSVTAVWKHSWSIPGSVLWNVLAGALFGPAPATVLLTLLTTIGSLTATMLAKPLTPLITALFPKVLATTRNALEGGEPGLDINAKPQNPAWVRLTVLRLIGVVPWSGLNIACGVCGVSWWDCGLSSFIGTMPWTAVTCQIGDILQTVASAPSPTPQTVSSLVASPEILFKLFLLSFLSLAPILGRDRLRTLLSSEPAVSQSPVEPKKKWRIHLRIPSRSRPSMRAGESQSQLEILIEEKNRSELERA